MIRIVRLKARLGVALRSWPRTKRALRTLWDWCSPISSPTKILTARLRGLERIYFVQIGSNDGMSGDPLRPLIEHDSRFTGIFVEPQPDAFKRLVSLYRGTGRDLHFENAAVAEKDGQRKLYFVDPAAAGQFPDLAGWSERVASLSYQHVVDHLGEAYRHLVVSMNVKCVSYRTLLATHCLPRVDLLHIDAEGHDAAILRTIDFDHCPPRVILFESSHMDWRAKRDIYAFLADNGYRLLPVDLDTLAERDDRCPNNKLRWIANEAARL
jgi:FkbM family methyltransferase